MNHAAERKKRADLGRDIPVAVGAAILAYAAFVLCVSSMNAGVAVVIFIGLFTILRGVFRDFIRQKVPKWCRAAVLICIIGGIAFASFLVIYGSFDNASYDEDAVIVLGAGLRGDTPTETLKRRLDAAANYHKQNPDAVIVLTGGQGRGETIPESVAMERYLIEKGVDESVIIKETMSTSTYENFEYAKLLLDERFGRECRIVVATSDYHVFRACYIAESAGFDDAAHCHGMSTWYLFAPNVLRECLAVVKQCLLDRL